MVGQALIQIILLGCASIGVMFVVGIFVGFLTTKVEGKKK